MRLPIDRSKKIALLKWLKQGYIDTLDIPEIINGNNAFTEYLIESGLIEDKQQEATTTKANKNE